MTRATAKKIALAKAAPKAQSNIPPTMTPEVQKRLMEQIESSQTMYVDSLVHLSIGSFTSKVAMGIQSATTNQTAGVINLAMPTSALLDMANHILRILSSEGTRDQLTLQFETFKAQLPVINGVSHH